MILALIVYAVPVYSNDKMVVGIKDSQPFVNVINLSESENRGISIELWEKVAKYNNIDYVYKRYSTVDELINASQTGEIDIGVAPISITANREKKVDLTHSYFQSGLSVAIINKEPTVIDLLLGALSNLGSVILISAVIMFIVGVPFWLLERHHNDVLQDDSDGAWWFDIFYWVATTVTTVGYGDVTPKTKWGRVYSIIIMWFGLFFAAAVTGYIVEAIGNTYERPVINSVHDLNGTVGVVSGSHAHEYAASQDLKMKSFSNLHEAVNALKTKKVDSIIHDNPILKYVSRDDSDIYVDNTLFTYENYGFVLNENNPLTETINRSMLSIIESPEWRMIVKSYK